MAEDDSKTNGTPVGDLEDFNCDKYEKEVTEMETDISKINDLSQSIDFFKDDNGAATEFVKKFNENVKLVEMQQSKLQIVWHNPYNFYPRVS